MATLPAAVSRPLNITLVAATPATRTTSRPATISESSAPRCYLNIRIELTSTVDDWVNSIHVEPTVTLPTFALDDTSFLEVKVEVKAKNEDEAWPHCSAATSSLTLSSASAYAPPVISATTRNATG